jgi:hypothetical protein
MNLNLASIVPILSLLAGCVTQIPNPEVPTVTPVPATPTWNPNRLQTIYQSCVVETIKMGVRRSQIDPFCKCLSDSIEESMTESQFDEISKHPAFSEYSNAIVIMCAQSIQGERI